MKRALRRSILVLVAVASVGLGGMVVTEQRMKENRRERVAFQARELTALKQSVNAPVGGDGPVSLHAGELTGVLARMMAQYDGPHVILNDWNLRFGTLTVSSVLLLLLGFTSFVVLERRENQFALATAEPTRTAAGV